MMAESVDATDLKSVEGNLVRVQVPLVAPQVKETPFTRAGFLFVLALERKLNLWLPGAPLKAPYSWTNFPAFTANFSSGAVWKTLLKCR